MGQIRNVSDAKRARYATHLMRIEGGNTMRSKYPARVLITGGREIGGVASFADASRAGFRDLGVTAEIVSPLRIFARWRDLRDLRVLKILSTTAVFAAPFARRAAESGPRG